MFSPSKWEIKLKNHLLAGGRQDRIVNCEDPTAPSRATGSNKAAIGAARREARSTRIFRLKLEE